MKKFERPKTVSEVREACRQSGHFIDTSKYDTEGNDWIMIEGVFAMKILTLIFCPFNGRFLSDVDGKMVSETSDNMDGTDWYDAILALLYVPTQAEKSEV